MGRDLTVGLAQPRPIGGEFSDHRNVNLALKLIEGLCRNNVDLVIFPEYFPFHDDRRILRASVDCGAYVVAGVRYLDEQGNVYNTATVYSPKEAVVRQGKRYIGRLESRLWGFKNWPGDYVVVDIGKAKLGVAVCADFWSFPEAAYELFLGGAEVFINPSFMFSLATHWIRATLSRSLEFYMPVIGVDSAAFSFSTGRRTFKGGGLSHVIVPPAGDEIELWWSSGADDTEPWIRLRLGVNEEVAVYSIDVDEVNRAREDWWLRMRGISLDNWKRVTSRYHRVAKVVRA